MNEDQYQKLKAKIEREHPARKTLAALGDLKRLDDETLVELFVRVQVLHPEREAEAREVFASALTGGVRA